MSFMRDTTFKKQQRQFEILAEATQEQESQLKQDIEGIADDLSQ